MGNPPAECKCILFYWLNNHAPSSCYCPHRRVPSPPQEIQQRRCLALQRSSRANWDENQHGRQYARGGAIWRATAGRDRSWVFWCGHSDATFLTLWWVVSKCKYFLKIFSLCKQTVITLPRFLTPHPGGWGSLVEWGCLCTWFFSYPEVLAKSKCPCIETCEKQLLQTQLKWLLENSTGLPCGCPLHRLLLLCSANLRSVWLKRVPFVSASPGKS